MRPGPWSRASAARYEPHERPSGLNVARNTGVEPLERRAGRVPRRRHRGRPRMARGPPRGEPGTPRGGGFRRAHPRPPGGPPATLLRAREASDHDPRPRCGRGPDPLRLGLEHGDPPRGPRAGRPVRCDAGGRRRRAGVAGTARRPGALRARRARRAPSQPWGRPPGTASAAPPTGAGARRGASMPAVAARRTIAR